MAHMINLQAGDRISLVCHAVKKGNSVQIQDHFMFATPVGTVADGMISDPEVYARELAAQLAEHGLKNVSEVNVTISSGKIATREIILPKVKDKQLDSMIHANADDYFPVDMKQYKLAYSVIGDAVDQKQSNASQQKTDENQKGDNARQQRPARQKSDKLRVLIKAAPKELLNSYVALSQKALFYIKTIDSSENSLYQALASIKMQGLVMYVNIDSVRMECTFMKDGQYVMQRSFTYGGDEMIYPYMQHNNMSDQNYMSAYTKLIQGGPDVVSKDEAEDLLNRCATSITRAADYLRTTKGMQVDGIVLLGTCAHLPYLRESIQEISGIEVAYIENIQETAVLVGKSADTARFLSTAASVIASINLIPDAYLANKSKKGFSFGNDDSYSGVIIVAVVCAAIGILLGLFSVLGYISKERELTDIQNEIAALQPAKQAYDEYTAYQANSDALDVIKDDAGGNNKKLRAFLEEMEARMPSDLLSSSIQATATSVVINCQTEDLDSVANVINEFRTFESIKIVDVSVPSVSNSGEDGGFSHETFTITCTFANDGSQAGKEAAAANGEQTTDTSSSSTSSSSSSSSSSTSSSSSSSTSSGQ